MSTIVAVDPEALEGLAERLNMTLDPARAERVGAETVFVGFGEYDVFSDGVRAVGLTLIADFGEWPYWAHWAGVDAVGQGLVATYCEGDWYLYRFADAAAAVAHVEGEHI